MLGKKELDAKALLDIYESQSREIRYTRTQTELSKLVLGKDYYDPKILVEYYKAQWADIHHTRNQDWQLFKVVGVGLAGVAGLKIFEKYEGNSDTVGLQIFFALIIAVLNFFAIAITIRHRYWFKEKMQALKKLENAMGLDYLDLFPPPKYNWFRRRFHIGTQEFLILIYSFTTVVFLSFIILSLYNLKRTGKIHLITNQFF